MRGTRQDDVNASRRLVRNWTQLFTAPRSTTMPAEEYRFFIHEYPEHDDGEPTQRVCL